MYLDCIVEIPDLQGKISRFKKGNTTYIRYADGRTYNPEKKYNVPNHKIIGRLSVDDPTRMIPNENFKKYLGDIELPEVRAGERRSGCLRIGAFLVVRKIMEDYDLPAMLSRQLGQKDCGLFLDLAAYSIVSENNAAQYYPNYAYNHPLFTPQMHIYSDSKISDFLAAIEDDKRIGFLNEWNASRDHREKIYISYDSTNKNCQAGDIDLVEFGHPKDDKGLPVFNYLIAYDTNNQEPLFYEQYPGNRSLRVQPDEVSNAKIFAEFVALIVRCKMYVRLKDEMEKLEKRPNYMTVPAAIRELEKIEMIRQSDGRYRLDHAVTAAQKTILKAFGMDANTVRKSAGELSDMLARYSELTRGD